MHLTFFTCFCFMHKAKCISSSKDLPRIKLHQIQGIENAYIIADNIDFASGNKIPIWLLGLLY